jgi:hypothetical protein
MRLTPVYLGLSALIFSLPIRAETQDSPKYEISPDAGFMGGSAMIGVRAAMNYHPVTLEMAASQVVGATAALYPVTLSVVLDLARLATVVPYGTVGGGLFLTVPTNSVGDETISSIGVSFGGGLRYYLSQRLGIRFETRQLFTRIDNRLDGREEILIFQSSSLGVIFAFG